MPQARSTVGGRLGAVTATTEGAGPEVTVDGDDGELRAMVRAFAEKELRARAAAGDRHDRFPEEGVAGLARLGLFGLAVPERFGGLSGSRLQMSVVIEELARVDASTAMTLMAHIHSTGVIARRGDDEQCERWLPRTASGECLAAIGLTEPDAGTDIGSMRSTARRDGDCYVLDGRKTFITNGGYAGVFVVFARTPGDGQEGKASLSAFVVPREAQGVSVSSPFDKMGLRASSTTDLILEQVRVPAADRLGDEGSGMRTALESLDGARMSTSAQAVGLATGAFELAIDYAASRTQSGKVIGHHQAVQIRLADMYIAISAASALLYRSSRLTDRDPSAGATVASATKVFCTKTASTVTSQAVELLGGYGFMEESTLPRYMRDAKGGEIYDGTNDVNRLLVARRLLREHR